MESRPGLAVDVDAIVGCMQALDLRGYEAEQNWEDHPAFILFYRRDDLDFARLVRSLWRQVHLDVHPQVHAEGYAACPLVPLTTTGQPPWEELRKMALNLAYASEVPECRDMLGLLQAEPVVAIGFMGEAYNAWVSDPVISDQVIHGGRDLRTLPHREERLVYAVDRTRRFYTQVRFLDRPYCTCIDADAGAGVAGSISTPLYLLMDAITGSVPPMGEFPVRYPSLRTLLPRKGSR